MLQPGRGAPPNALAYNFPAQFQVATPSDDEPPGNHPIVAALVGRPFLRRGIEMSEFRWATTLKNLHSHSRRRRLFGNCVPGLFGRQGSEVSELHELRRIHRQRRLAELERRKRQDKNTKVGSNLVGT